MSEQKRARKKPSTTSSPSFTPRSGLIQRKCACGGSAGVDGECAECRSKRLSVQRSPAAQTERTTVPPVVHEVLNSPGQPLDAETRAYMEPRFGHDFSKVRVHADGKAAESAQAINALAYTAGRDIAFDKGQYAPETTGGKKLLAHELTHVVQQSTVSSINTPARSGAFISDPSDTFERAAENTAAAVTSAGPSTAQTPIVAGAFPSIQRQRAVHKPAEKVETDDQVASNALRAVADVLHYGQLRLLGGVDSKYQGAILELHAAQVGTSNGKKIPAAERLRMFEAAIAKLHPAILALEKDREQREWLATEVTVYIDQLRENLNLAKAQERIEQVEIPEQTAGEGSKSASKPAESTQAEAATLRERLPKLIETVKTINEQLLKMHELLHKEEKEAIETAEHEIAQSNLPEELKHKGFSVGMLEELGHVLTISGSLLKLSDKDFQKELGEVHKFFPGVASYSELVKAILELTDGSIGVSASVLKVIAKASGKTTWVTQIAHVSETTGKVLGKVTAAIDIVHGLAIVFDKEAKPEKREEAGADVAIGLAELAGGLPASMAVRITYYELKLMADLYGKARTGIMGGWMNMAFETMNDAARNIGFEANTLAKAGLLLASEKNPQQIRALSAIQTEYAVRLGYTIDDFLDDCKPTGYGPGAAFKPGAYEVLRPVFAPLLPLKGAQTPQAAAAAAIAVLQKIGWCLDHAQELLREASGLLAKEGGTEEHKTGKGGAHE